MWRHPAFAIVLAAGLSCAAAIPAEISVDLHRAQLAERELAQERAATATVEREQGKALVMVSSAKEAADVQVGALSASLDAANADRDAKQQEIDRLKALTAYSPGYGGSGAAPAVGNRFPWGYCTWYVASRRSVPWSGNAWQWFGAARSLGWPTGMAPHAGAIMVTWEHFPFGPNFGHVAFVESVAGDGSWTVSEMNYRGFGVISGRTIRPGGVPLIGFIY